MNNNLTNDLINDILNFLHKAGDIAINYQYKLSANIKSDESIVTEADLTISRLFNQQFSNYLKLDNHFLLDEENLPDKNNLFNDKNEYLWTLDPIDGTTTYYNGFPLWAIGLSLYKNFNPYISFIYFPSIKELIYTDGKYSYYIKNAFSNNEIKTNLILKDTVLTKKSIILQHRLKNYDVNKFVILDLYSSYVSGFYTLVGKSVASFFNKPMKLWDITATLPIAKNIGLSIKNIKTNTTINNLQDINIDENWYLNDNYLMCNDKIYNDIIKELL